MKRDLTNSRTYMPPIVLEVDLCAEQPLLVDSRMNFSTQSTVDEADNVNSREVTTGEKFYWDGFTE